MADNTTLPGMGEIYRSREISSVKYQIIEAQVFHLNLTANGAGVLNETITPTAGKAWRLLAIKLHVDAMPATSENFVVQIKDGSQARYNTVLLTQDMNTVTDLVTQYDGYGMPITADRTLDFDWANTDTNGWGLTVTYLEDY